MIYQINSPLEDKVYLLENNKEYKIQEFNQLIKAIKFQLSHHVDMETVLGILCKDFGFRLVETTEL